MKVKLINNIGKTKEFEPEHAKNILAMENGGNWKVVQEQPKKENGNSGNKGLDKGETKE